MKENDKLAIIILNKDNTELLFDCLTSIREKTEFKNYHIYLGDTGSTKENLDKIANYLKTYFSKKKNATLIQFNYYNFAKNNNEIIKKYVKDENLLLFCNNDIKLIDDCITEGIKMYRRNKDKVGTIGFKLLFGDGTIQHAGQVIFEENKIFRGVTHRGLKQTSDKFSKRELVIGNTMALLLTTKKLYNEINGLSEDYIECLEDVQYNIECILRGKHNIYIGDRVAWHYESQTRNKDPNKNKMLLYDTNKTLIPFINKNINKILESKLVYGITK